MLLNTSKRWGWWRFGGCFTFFIFFMLFLYKSIKKGVNLHHLHHGVTRSMAGSGSVHSAFPWCPLPPAKVLSRPKDEEGQLAQANEKQVRNEKSCSRLEVVHVAV